MSGIESLIPAEWTVRVVHAQPLEFWAGTLFVCALSALGFFFAFRFFSRARLIEDMPTSKVRSAAQGYVELEGHGELMRGEPIVSPLTGRTCTWYQYKIEERVESYDSRGNRQSRWRTIDGGTSDELFLLVDETGACVIDPEGAEVIPSSEDSWYGNNPTWSNGLPSSRGLGGMLSGGRYRYSEKRMEPGDPLYALGMFHSVGGSQELPNTREEVRHLLTLWKRDQAELLRRFDTNGDGQIDLQEWELARQAAHKEVLKSQRERFNRPMTNIMAKPEDSRRPFLLSVMPQDGMARRMRYYAIGAFFGFLLSGGAATWLLTVRLSH